MAWKGILRGGFDDSSMGCSGCLALVGLGLLVLWLISNVGPSAPTYDASGRRISHSGKIDQTPEPHHAPRNINVRSGPSTSTTVEFQLTAGDLAYLGKVNSSGWAPVYVGDEVAGYVFARLLRPGYPRGDETPTASPDRRNTIPDDLEHHILKESSYGNARRSVDVRISRKVDESALRALAHHYRGTSPESFSRTFIVYYLPGMVVDAGGWATTHFTPDLEVRILGPTLEADAAAEAAEEEHGDEVVGVWEKTSPGLTSGTYMLLRDEAAYRMKHVFSDGGSTIEEVEERTSSRGRKFVDPENQFGEYYLVRNNRLELHDPEGVVFSAPPKR